MRIIQFAGYVALLFVIAAFSIIPFKVLYIFSDVLAAVFYHILPYRKKLITQNLTKAFPEKTPSEIDWICRDFYINLSDILLEALKGFSLNKTSIRKHYKIHPNAELDQYFRENRPVLGLTGHLSNWEWGPYALGLSLEHRVLGVYKKVKHPYIDNLLIRSRSKFNVLLSEMKEVDQRMKEAVAGYPILLMLIADQSPTDPKKAYWLKFLNRDTPFFYGPQKFMSEYNLPVFFFNIRRIKRGYYEVFIETLTKDPASLKEGEIIEKYRDVMEREIRNRPADWLWSHNRWKHAKK